MLLVNLLAINIGSSAAFTLVMVVQNDLYRSTQYHKYIDENANQTRHHRCFLWLNPVAHTVLGWHRSTLLEVELANSRYSLNLVTSILIPASILYRYCSDGRTIDTEEGFTGRGHGNGDNLI